MVVNANFTGVAWLKMLSAQSEYDCNVYNVTFAPGTRNNWHSHAVGQILLCSHALCLWGAPKQMEQQSQEEVESEDNDTLNFYPICFVFSNLQVYEKE